MCLFLVSLWLRGEKSAVRPVGGWRTVFMSEPLFVCLSVGSSVSMITQKTTEQSLNRGSVKNKPHYLQDKGTDAGIFSHFLV